MNKSRIITIIILVIVVVGIFVFAVKLNDIVKEGLETVGPQITKVSVELESVNIVLFTGSAKVKGLVIGNPEGYKAPQAISIGLAEVGINPLSILSDKIVVRTIHVISPEITYEGGLSGNNLSKIIDNLDAYSKKGVMPSTNAPAPAVNQTSKKIEVDDFLVTGAKVHARLTDLAGKEMTLSLPDIHLTNLGTSGDGLTPANLTKALLKAVASATAKAVSSGAAGLGKSVEKGTEDTIKKDLGGVMGK